VVTKDVDSAVTAIIKLAIGKALFDKLDMDAYIKQIKKSQTNSVKLSEALALSSHPLTANRVANLVSFWRENFQRRAEGVS
jgi:Zn-dependent protease with chaperone function